jgi:hypothetical protein
MAACVGTGSVSYAVLLSEGEDAPDDQTLLDAATQELLELYENGILPEKITPDTLTDRSFMEVYVLPQGEESATLPDLYFWKLTVPVENGQLVLCMDRSFYKIYFLSLETDYVDEATSFQKWIYKTRPDDVKELAQKWCRYWELEDVTLTDTPLENESKNTSVYDKTGDRDSVSLLFPNRHYLTVFYEWVDYISQGKSGGWLTMSGLLEFQDYSTIQF